jgi:hypothetical protein
MCVRDDRDSWVRICAFTVSNIQESQQICHRMSLISVSITCALPLSLFQDAFSGCEVQIGRQVKLNPWPLGASREAQVNSTSTRFLQRLWSQGPRAQTLTSSFHGSGSENGMFHNMAQLTCTPWTAWTESLMRTTEPSPAGP